MQWASLPSGEWSCMWTARCDSPSLGLTPHPILGYVPVCEKHADGQPVIPWSEVEILGPGQESTGAAALTFIVEEAS